MPNYWKLTFVRRLLPKIGLKLGTINLGYKMVFIEREHISELNKKLGQISAAHKIPN